MADTIELILNRIGSEFDGECHLSEDEARAITTELEALRRRVEELEADCARKDGLLTAAVDDYNDARRLAIEECAKVAYAIQPPKSIGRDHGRHHMAGAQAAAAAIRALRDARGETAE